MQSKTFRVNLDVARDLWGDLSKISLQCLEDLSKRYSLSIASGDLLQLEGRWYVTHAGLLGIARRKRCMGIQVRPAVRFCDPAASRWAFKATVFKSRNCKGFAGFGDADPSNISPLVQGAEMRVAETRAVNRALRKAYGIGICSVEEIGSLAGHPGSAVESKKRPQPSNGKANGNFGGRTVRDRLCQLIRQHGLDATLVKSYATDFCGVKALRDTTREQVENFVVHLADWAEKDRNALLCQLNNHGSAKAGAA
ncbi:MAG TPA: hypothetical protein VEH30_09450 [Terriglobales bacterium]|nr:hypothetical protein [Terriglobales bacterium]